MTQMPYSERLLRAAVRVYMECPDHEIAQAVGYLEQIVVMNRIREADEREHARERPRARKRRPTLPVIEVGSNVVPFEPA